MRFTHQRAINILLITDGLVLLAAAMLGPIYALYVEKIGGDLLDASYTFAVFALATGLATLVAGYYADHIKENELVLIVGYAIIGLSFLAYLIVDSIWMLLAVQVFFGLGKAIQLPAFDAIYSKHLDERRSGRQWGTWEAINNFAMGLGAVLGGVLVVKFGFNVMFVVMASLCFLSALYILTLPRKAL